MTPDQALSQFELLEKGFASYKQADISEADTRSKVIDAFLMNVLGWKEEDITREGYTGNGYFDYKVSSSVFRFVIEAKRNFNELTLPTKSRRITLKTLLRGNKEVIMQIRAYLVDEGLSHGVITNGRQFIVGKFINQNGSKWQDNEVLIFNGFDDIRENFILFYNNISKTSLIQHGGFHFEHQPAIGGKSLSSHIVDIGREVTRNTISSKIASLIDLMFGDIFVDGLETDEEFLRECFVENNETRKNREEIERLFGDYAPALHEVVPANNAESINEQVQGEIALWNDLTRDKAPNPIILVGSKGVGKTTFINFLIRHKLTQSIRRSNIFVYLDFRKYYDDERRFQENEIAQDAIDILVSGNPDFKLDELETLKRIYKKQIHYYDSNIWRHLKGSEGAYNEKIAEFISQRLNDSVKHLEKISLYLLANQQRRVVLVFDNCDQFSEELQQKVFLFSHALQANAKCGVILALREGYYYRWRVRRPFDAYVSNVYHISTPRYGHILQKRINYTLKKLEQKGKIVQGDLSTGVHLTISIDKISRFLDSLNQSLFYSDNNDIVDYLNFTTFPNIREGLSVFKSYLTSGHTNVEDIILRDGAEDRQRKANLIPLHEFIKAIALHNHIYYQSDLSLVKNIYFPNVDSSDHFIKLRLLQHFDELHKQTDGHQHEHIEQTIDMFHDLGYRRLDCKHAINTLFLWRLVDTDQLLSDVDSESTVPDDAALGITTKGHYYLDSLVWSFLYIDLILQDTPLYLAEDYEKIKAKLPAPDSKGKRPLSIRLECTEDFLKYLTKMAEREPRAVNIRFGDVINDFLQPKFQADIAEVTRRMARR